MNPVLAFAALHTQSMHLHWLKESESGTVATVQAVCMHQTTQQRVLDVACRAMFWPRAVLASMLQARLMLIMQACRLWQMPGS